MRRQLLKYLQDWATSPVHKPLLLRGARQVGKTFLVETLGAQFFADQVTINFELEPQHKNSFISMHPEAILNAIRLTQKKPIIPGKTLLFLDEIQTHPPAIQALRYFKEQMPELHVIAAGSLLEFALQQEKISMPVGRVEYLYLYPCSFSEFLLNSGYDALQVAMAEAHFENALPLAAHEQLLKLFREYMIVGGMPEALQNYFNTKDLYQVQRVQNSVLQTYRDDFGKYARFSQHKYLQVIFDKTPGLVGTQVRYHKLDAEMRSRDLKSAIELLEYAGVIKRIFATSATGLPFSATLQDKKFKMQFLDIGLTQRKTGMGTAVLLHENILQINAGGLAEQVVGQELLAYQDPFSAPELYFWARDVQGAQAEVDFILNISGKIIPIEVKSGANGRLKSLQMFLKERNLPFGVKVSEAPLSREKNILNVPIYMLSQLERLVK